MDLWPNNQWPVVLLVKNPRANLMLINHHYVLFRTQDIMSKQTSKQANKLTTVTNIQIESTTAFPVCPDETTDRICACPHDPRLRFNADRPPPEKRRAEHPKQSLLGWHIRKFSGYISVICGSSSSFLLFESQMLMVTTCVLMTASNLFWWSYPRFSGDVWCLARRGWPSWAPFLWHQCWLWKSHGEIKEGSLEISNNSANKHEFRMMSDFQLSKWWCSFQYANALNALP